MRNHNAPGADTGTAPTSGVGDRRSRQRSPRSVSSPVPGVGWDTPDVSASRPRLTTSAPDLSAAMTPPRTPGPRAAHVIDNGGTVPHFLPTRQHARPGFPSPNGGGDLADELAALHGRYWVEAERWPHTRRNAIRATAEIVTAARDALITGAMSIDHAEIWAQASDQHLADIVRERSAANHPAGRGRA